MKLPLKTQNGFTVVEMLLYMGILSIFLLVLTQLFTMTLDLQLEAQASSALTSDSRYILLKILSDANQASDIDLPSSYGATGSTMRFIKETSQITYSLNQGNLLRTDAGGSDPLNSFATLVTTFTAQKLGRTGGKPTVKINLTLENINSKSGTPETKSLETTLGVR